MKFRQVKPSALVDINGVAGPRRHRGARRRAPRGRARAPAARCSRTSVVGASLAAAARGGQVRRLPGDAPPRHRRRLARLRGPVGRADRRRGRARRGDRRPLAERGERTIQARAFFRGPNETALEPGELIVRVRFPAPRGAIGRRVPRGQRPLPRLLRRSRAAAVVARRRRSGRPRPPPRRADAVPRRRLARARRTTERSTSCSPGSSPPDDIEVSGALPAPRRSASSPAARCATPPTHARQEGERVTATLNASAIAGQRRARTSARSSRGGRWPTSCATTST